jgi:hypothetical protein
MPYRRFDLTVALPGGESPGWAPIWLCTELTQNADLRVLHRVKPELKQTHLRNNKTNRTLNTRKKSKKLHWIDSIELRLSAKWPG